MYSMQLYIMFMFEVFVCGVVAELRSKSACPGCHIQNVHVDLHARVTRSVYLRGSGILGVGESMDVYLQTHGHHKAVLM